MPLAAELDDWPAEGAAWLGCAAGEEAADAEGAALEADADAALDAALEAALEDAADAALEAGADFPMAEDEDASPEAADADGDAEPEAALDELDAAEDVHPTATTSASAHTDATTTDLSKRVDFMMVSFPSQLR